MRTWKYCSI